MVLGREWQASVSARNSRDSLASAGRYCDDLRPYVCNAHQRGTAAGKQQASWKYVENIANSGSKQYSYHSTKRNSKSSSSEWSKSLTTSVSAGVFLKGGFFEC